MMLDGITETLRREIPLPSPECALQDGIVAVGRANRERRAAAQVIERFALTDQERAAIETAALALQDLHVGCVDVASTLRNLLERLK